MPFIAPDDSARILHERGRYLWGQASCGGLGVAPHTSRKKQHGRA